MEATLRCAAAALLVALAGCGADDGRLSKREYVERLRALEGSAASQTAGRSFTEIVVDPGLPRNRCWTTTRRLERSLDELVDQVEKLRPPQEVQALQDRFVAAARQSVAAVGRAAGDAEAGRLRCGTPMNHRIYGLPSTKRAEQVIYELGRRGYVIGLNAED